MCQTVCHGTVACNVFRKECPTQTVTGRREELLNTPVLVSKLNLKMQYPLTVAYEPEVTGLDHTCMNGPHSHLMKLLALHAVEWIVIHHTEPVSPVMRIPHRFEPGMTLENHT